MSIKILCNLYYNPSAQLTSFLSTNKDMYIPINCGNLKVPNPSKWISDHVVFEDDLPDNISGLNYKLNENTAIYAAWKNNLFGDAQYVGHTHYRRLFDPKDLEDINDYDLVVNEPVPMRFNTSALTGAKEPNIVETTVQMGYQICHNLEDFFKMESYVRNSPYGILFKEWASESTLFAPMNLFVMKRAMFNQYCEWMFPILLQLEKEISIEGRDNYQKRVLAFLAERMLSLFAYTKMKQGKKVKKVKNIYLNNEKPYTATDKRGEYDDSASVPNEE